MRLLARAEGVEPAVTATPRGQIREANQVPNGDSPRAAIDVDQVLGIADKLIAAANTYKETRASVDAISTHFDTLRADIAKFQETVRVHLMERLDRLQDEQTKQRLEMEAAVQLLRDTAPTELLVRIRQLQDEIRELKEAKDRPSQ
jgi:hypothetical protein